MKKDIERREPWGYKVGDHPGSETAHWQKALWDIQGTR